MAGRHVITIEFKNLSFPEMNGNFRFITSHEVEMIFEFSIVTLMFMRDFMDTTTNPSLIHSRKRK